MSDYEFNYNQGNYTPAPGQYGGDGAGPGGPKKPKKKKGFAGLIAAVAVTGVLAGSLLTGFVIMPTINQMQAGQMEVLPNETAAASEMPEPAQSSTEFGGQAADIQNVANPVPEIAEQVADSVVGVITYNKSYISGQEPVEQALTSGTGFVISNDGYILTNNHVIDSGNTIKVRTSDGEEHAAELIGQDPNTEIAVLKVEGLGLPALALGDSDAAKTGELVVAVGNPLSDQLYGTVTVGYLSATNRSMQLSTNGEEMEMLQTDAAINPGNSGGPLINSKGEVIGINTMKRIFAGTDSYGNAISAEGIGFAIPINKAMDIAQQLIENGSVPQPVRPGIGFTYQPISAEDAEMWQVPRGIMIAGVVEGSPAEKAGLTTFDVITQIDGVDLTTGADVPTFDDRQVGDTVNATVWRDGKEMQVQFVLEDLNTLESN